MAENRVEPLNGNYGRVAMTDRWSYGWLALGVLLACFASGNQAIGLAAWLGPVFLVRFLRTQNLPRGFGMGLAALVIPSLAITWPILDLESLSYPLRLGAVILNDIRFFLPFLADRLIAPRLKGFASTLALPAAWVSLDYLYSLGPEGTWGALAYSQYGQLDLLQLGSVTGIWGVTFLVAWLAGVVNWAWERAWVWPQVRRGVLGYVGLLALVMLVGGARVALSDLASKTVVVAGLNRPERLPLKLDFRVSRNLACRNAAEEQSYFLAKTVEAARLGAKLVIWQEYAVLLYAEDEASFRSRARETAQREGIYLIMSFGTYPPGAPEESWTNKLVGIDPSGQELWEYRKSYPSSALEPGLVPGDRRLPFFDTPYGRMAAVICTDQEHPGLLRQAGRAGAFLILSSSAAWPGVDPLHAHMAAFRAIENGACLFKTCGQARSVAYDSLGLVLGRLDYDPDGAGLFMAQIPLQGRGTIYPWIGDLLAWLCLALTAALAVAAWRRGRV